MKQELYDAITQEIEEIAKGDNPGLSRQLLLGYASQLNRLLLRVWQNLPTEEKDFLVKVLLVSDSISEAYQHTGPALEAELAQDTRPDKDVLYFALSREYDAAKAEWKRRKREREQEREREVEN